MLQLEVVVVVVSLGAEAYFLHFLLHLFLLELLGAFLLLIEELAIVDEPTNGRVGIGRNLHKVNALLTRHIQSLTGGHDGRSAVAYDAYLAHSDLLIDAVLGSFFVVLHSTVL